MPFVFTKLTTALLLVRSQAFLSTTDSTENEKHNSAHNIGLPRLPRDSRLSDRNALFVQPIRLGRQEYRWSHPSGGYHYM
ncbi:hypothetical protein C8Q74DRAFT_1273465 [Fomes fomentarius]|nr:hypothetical protein C8Q74DRAFT_1273465 [Fomes fomentarius]